MMKWKLSGSTALALIFFCTGAQAQVTPEGVWESWQSLSASAGQTLTSGSETRDGDTLQVTDVDITMTDETGGNFVATIPELNFTDRGDGTVEVTMSDSYQMTLTFPDEVEDSPASLTLTVAQPGITIIAGGTEDQTTYDFAAPTVSVTLDEIIDKDGTTADATASAVVSDVDASYLVTRTGETTALESRFTASGVDLTFAGVDTEDNTRFNGEVTMADLSGTSAGTFLGAQIMANMANALNAGFATDGTFEFGAMTVNLDVTEEGAPTNVAGAAEGGSFVLSMNRERVNYGSSLTGASFTVSGADIPFPEVTLAFGESAFNILVPVSRSETPQDFAFLTSLVDLTVSDDVWGMFDPAGTLSREPATIILDAKGTGFWKEDIMDPETEMDGVEAPGELTSLDLTQILLKAVGTEIAAEGDLTFDNTDLTTFDGVPAPTGVINVNIKGVNALIDNLIALGFVPEDQAMGARMMLGMFARPGAGPDELTSTLEFKDKGFYANGQRLR